ncbi:hypothetical protein C2E21_3832 [Chlorella sorokiniana]|jgi:peroxiredoxin|uniref:Peroxiredoxin-like 2A n=1 Tax=Chlorella sorokiniana TaxID=3076 RepID=A0A2P6TSW9_CHLSO|nr:hypothetical protein C2E21_3832 [Chlorella sorokiniana]|eukprot:PRW57143.1 hypothetical protein C2E21_3832 [Chlorella sorokiniana]
MASYKTAQLLKGKGGEAIPAADLWKDGPCLVVALRRPGCLLCREESIKVWNARQQFEEAGVRLVCVLHEWIDREVDAFRPEYWGGELYYDQDKAFYAAVHGGKPARASLLQLLSPTVWRAGKRAKESGLVKESNYKGDGLTLGGLLIIKKGGDIAYSYAEKTFGDHAPMEEVLAAAKAAGGKA